MHAIRSITYIFLAFLLLSPPLLAQQKKTEPPGLDEQQGEQASDPLTDFLSAGGIRYSFGEENKSFIKFGVGAQFWARQIWNNPGSVGVEGDTIGQTFDVALRRMRFSVTGHFNRYFTLYTQLGITNQSFVSGGTYSPGGPNNKKPPIFFHDFWAKFHVLPGQLNVGMGLNYYNGVSRLTNVSYKSNFMLDNPTFNFPNIGHTDQVGRQLGFFAEGTIARLNYRLAYTKPFVYADPQRDNPPVGRAFEAENDNMSVKGYAFWQFWDTESALTPFMPMTYLGSKQIFNIGAGFDYHPGSTISMNAAGEEQRHNRLSLGADIFMELPTENAGAFNMYVVGYHYDYGPNFLRSSASLNITGGGFLNGEPLPQGGGHQQFILGTGNLVYASFGYLLRQKFFSSRGRLQPFYAYTYKDFEGMGTSTMQHDFGLNYLLHGQNIKFSLQYSSRPIYQGSVGSDARGEVVDTRGLVIFQTQILL